MGRIALKALVALALGISAAAQAKDQPLPMFIDAAGAEHALGLKAPAGWAKQGEWDDRAVQTATLPSRWDWNDYARLQPIRDQRSCGSCWSFAITAMTESIHRLLYPYFWPMIDLAEQTLVSTCESGGDCGGGYFTALNYVRDKGLPPESEDPYKAKNSSCKSGLHPQAKITRWAYIGSGGQSSPTTEQVKQAILDHGPVVIDINGSLNYSSGVYTSCNTSGTNHMVVIDGWQDDAAYASYGGGYWKVRNSWGAGWGEKGYIRIVYKKKGSSVRCNRVAETAAYAVMDGIENLREYLGIPLPL